MEWFQSKSTDYRYVAEDLLMGPLCQSPVYTQGSLTDLTLVPMLLSMTSGDLANGQVLSYDFIQM